MRCAASAGHDGRNLLVLQFLEIAEFSPGQEVLQCQLPRMYAGEYLKYTGLKC